MKDILRTIFLIPMFLGLFVFILLFTVIEWLFEE